MRRPLVVRTTLIVAMVAFLEVAPRLGFGDAVTLVPLSEIVVRTWELAVAGQLNEHVTATGGAVFVAFCISAVTGLAGGLVLWRLPLLHQALAPYLTAYYAVPIFAFYPLLLAVLGFNLWPVITIAWAWAVVAVVLNTAIGLRNIPPVLIKAGRSMGLSRAQLVSRVFLPAAVPYIFTGLKLGMVYSLIGVVASEFVLSTRGLGYLVGFNYNSFRVADMYVAMYVVVFVAIVLNSSLTLIERRLYGRG